MPTERPSRSWVLAVNMGIGEPSKASLVREMGLGARQTVMVCKVSGREEMDTEGEGVLSLQRLGKL